MTKSTHSNSHSLLPEDQEGLNLAEAWERLKAFCQTQERDSLHKLLQDGQVLKSDSQETLGTLLVLRERLKLYVQLNAELEGIERRLRNARQPGQQSNPYSRG